MGLGCVPASRANYMAVWECCDEEGEAAPADVEREEVEG